MRRIWSLGLLAVLCLHVAASASAGAVPVDEGPTFVNPVMKTGNDPWVIRRGGFYYLCQSIKGSVWVARFERLVDMGRAEWVRVWTPPKGRAYSLSLWAPELHYLRGKWYIYVAADDGENANHRMYALEGTTQDPLDPFEFRGKVAAEPDRWAIDGTVLEMPDGVLYMVWSGWEGTDNVAQNLYIARMKDPLTIEGERVLISRPELPFEVKDRPLINEGPEALWHEGRLFLIYSASGSWGDNYCMGQLTWTGGEVMAPASWVKKPEAVFESTEGVYGPGHGSFVKSRDGTEDWMVYHVAKHAGAGWNRQVHMQRFEWAPDGSPRFGVPVKAGVPIRVPSGD